MDITRAPGSFHRRRRRILVVALVAAIVPLGFVGISQLEPASPTVQKGAVWIDTVRRGTMLRQVRGIGTLVSEATWWIPATTDARVERILVQPGGAVTAETIIMELSNPELEQEALETEWGLKAAVAELRNLEVHLRGERLERKAAVTEMEARNAEAQLLSSRDEALNAKGYSTRLETAITRTRAGDLADRLRLEQERLGIHAESVQAQLAVQRSRIEQLRALAALKRGRVESLRVRAGIDGVLQQLPVQVGQHIVIGTTLAKVAQQGQLKGELKVAETEAKDITPGQKVVIDTRNGTVEGRVSRIDPSVQNGTVTVDVALEGTLPAGARPDLGSSWNASRTSSISVARRVVARDGRSPSSASPPMATRHCVYRCSSDEAPSAPWKCSGAFAKGIG
jgi:HlyD family secretion protein